MGKFEVNQKDVKGDGRIILYQRPRSDGSIISTWQMRISVPNSTGYHISSTKEKDELEASRKALNTYEKLYMDVMNGGTLKSINFKSVYKEWVIDFPKTNKHKSERYIGDRLKIVGKYPLTFFGNLKIKNIEKKTFNDFWRWRNENSIKINPMTKKETPFTPSPNSLRKEVSILKLFFSYALDEGYIQTIPDMNQPSLFKNRRPTFSVEEWRLLTRRMREWVKEGQKWGGVERGRFLLQQYILILSNCGCRLGEIRFLKWNELETKKLDDSTSRLIGTVTGKTGQRQVVFNEGAETYVKQIYDMRKKELNNNPPSDGYVICHKDGTPIDSLRKGFDNLLEYCKLTNNSKGEKRTLYSLRHFYATQRLSEEVSPFLLARNMGTSIEMLEKHYGQIVNDLVALEITKTKGKRTTPSLNINDYPFD